MSENYLKQTSPNFTFYPLFWLALCFIFGILSAEFLAIDWRVFLVLCLFSIIFTSVFHKEKYALIFLFSAFISAGGLYFNIENHFVAPNRIKTFYDEKQIISGDPIEIEGFLQGKPELSISGIFLELETERAIYKSAEMKVSGKVRLFAPIGDEEIAAEFNELDLRHGSRIRVVCNLKRENDFQNPGVISQKEILDQTEIDAIGIIKSPLLVEKLDNSSNFAPLTWIYEQRENLIEDIHKNFNVSTAGVLIASLLGNRNFLDKQTAEAFREGGTFHILVISGLHITFIGGLILLFVRFFTRKRLWQFLTASLILWSYAIAVGADVPVVRAAIMFSILLFALVVYRRGNLLNALGASVIILLVWRPNDLFSPSFQLTAVSVTAIIAMAFPLIEKLRSIGAWSPSVETPFPPNVPKWLKRFCETLYWREAIWEREISQHIWTAKLFKKPYFNRLEKRNLQKILSYLFEGVLISLIVQLWLLPLTIIYFHRVSFFGVFLNLWVGFILAFESFTAFFAVLMVQISNTAAFPFIKITEFINQVLLSVPQFLTENLWASMRLPHYSGALKSVYFFYFLPILFFAIALNRWKPFSLVSNLKFLQISGQEETTKFGDEVLKNRYFVFSSPRTFQTAALIFLVLFGLIVFHPFSAPAPDGKLHIDFLDVGQGDSALITFPDGETLLVDGGGKGNFNKIYLQNESEGESELFEPDRQNIGEMVVSAFLWEKGYDKVDYILATHADADHIQGLSDVARNFKVKAAMFGRTPLKNREFADLYEILQKRGIPVLTLSRGDVLTFGDARIETLYPEKDDLPEAISDNNHSVVLRVIFGKRTFLLTGDIEKEAERELLTVPGFLQSDVVKVAHHGSRTSSTQDFINATRAKLVVIPVGRTSPFGHPHKEVLERWTNSGAKIITTGERGTISISTDGNDLQLKTFLR